MAVVVFDLDGTVIRGDSFVKFLLGCLWAHPLRWWRCAHLPFAVVAHVLGLRDNSWLKAVFVRAILGGLKRAELDGVAQTLNDRLCRNNLKGEAEQAIARLREEGHELVLASASLDTYIDPLASRLGFDVAIATELEWHDDVCTGQIKGVNCYGDAKRAAVAAQYPSVAAAYSDHHSDLPLLTLADRGYAVDPTSRLANAAPGHDLEVLRWDA